MHGTGVVGGNLILPMHYNKCVKMTCISVSKLHNAFFTGQFSCIKIAQRRIYFTIFVKNSIL